MARTTKADLQDEIARLRARIRELEADRDLPIAKRQADAVISWTDIVRAGYATGHEQGTPTPSNGGNNALDDVAQIVDLGLWVWNHLDNRLEYFSEDLPKLLGLTSNELIESFANGQDEATTHQDDLKRYNEVVEAAAEQRKPYIVDYRQRTATGEERYFLERGEPILDAQGRLVRTAGTVQDITQYREAIESSRQHELLFHEAARLAKLGHWIWGEKEQRYIFCSEELARIYGQDPSTCVDYFNTGELYAGIHPDDVEQYRAIVDEADAMRRPYSVEFREYLDDGELHHMRERTQPIFDLQGNWISTVGMIQDITEQKEALARLRQSSDNFRALVEGSIQGIVIHRNMRPLFANKACAEIFGLDNVDDFLATKNLLDLVHPDDRRAIKEHYKARLRGDDTASNQILRFVRQDGATIWLESFISDVEWENEPAILATFVDVTKRKLSEDALLRAHEDLERRVQARTAELETINAALQREILERRHTDERLAASEERLRQACRLVGLGHYVWDSIEDRCLVCSDEQARIYGTTPEGYIARASGLPGNYPFVHPDEEDRYAAAIGSMRRTGKGFEIEYRTLTVDGDVRHVHEIVRPVLDADGRVILELGVTQDITERKRTEDALREQGARLREALDIAKLGHWSWDPATEELTISPELARIFGRAQDAPNRVDYSEFSARYFHPDDVEWVDTFLELPHETNIRKEAEFRIVTEAGETKWIFVVTETVADRLGQYAGSIGTAQDITERKQTEELLREQEARLREALHVAKLSYWNWDERTDVVTFSSEMARILGHRDNGPLSMTFGTYLKTYVHPEDAERVRADMEISQEPGSRYETKYRLITESGDIRWIADVGEVAVSASGKFTGEVGTVQDITETTRTDEILREQEAQLREALHIAKLGHWSWDSQTNELVIPAELARMLARPDGAPDRMDYDAYMERYVHPDDLAWVKAELDLSEEQGLRRQAEYRMVRDDGGILWALVIAETAFDQSGRFVGEVGTVQDITERKEAEQIIREQEARVRDALVIAKLDHWSWNAQTNELKVEPGSANILGWPEDSTFCIDYDEFLERHIHPADLERARFVTETDNEPGAVHQFELRLVTDTGDVKWVAVTGEAVHDEAGNFIGKVGTTQDITERKKAEQIVQRSEARLAKALHQSRLAHWTFDFAKHEITEWSDEAAYLLGIQPHDLPRRYEEWLDWVHPEDRAKVAACYAPKDFARPALDDYQVEYRIRRGDGSYMWLYEMAEVEHDTLGNQVAFVGAIQDITARKVPELALRESEERFRSLVDNSPSAIYLKGRDGKYQMANRQFEEWYGIAVEDALGRTTHDLFPKDFADVYAEMDRCVLDTGRTIIREVEAPFADGSTHVVLATKFPVASADGGIDGIGTINMDITDHKRAQSALDEQRLLLETIIGAADIAINVKDKDSRYIFVNETAAAVFGLKPEDMIGKTPAEAVDEDHGRQVEEFDGRALASGLPWTRFEHRNQDAQGQERSWLTTKAIVRNDDGALRYIVSSSVDLTDLKAREQELKQAQKMDALGKLTSGIAHDFNNLLLLINANLFVLQRDDVAKEDIRRAADSIRLATETANNLTRSLMAFSRDQPLAPAAVDLRETIDNTVNSLFRTLMGDMEIVTSYKGDIKPVLIDSQYLENALLNLALNARDAMPDGGTVKITVQNFDRARSAAVPGLPAGDFVKIAVSDTGVGMTPDVLDQALQPFFTTKAKGSGTGLGLSMVYRFVKQSGGHITLESRPNKGTTVSIYLPVAAAAIAPADDVDLLAPDVATYDLTILVTEDDEPVRRMTVGLLRDMGFQTLEAADADQALSMVAADPSIDLLFSDVYLKGSINGYELATKAKKLRSDLKIAFCSGNAKPPGPDSSIAEAPLLRKPYSPDDLRRTITTMMARDRKPAPPPLGSDRATTGPASPSP